MKIASFCIAAIGISISSYSIYKFHIIGYQNMTDFQRYIWGKWIATGFAACLISFLLYNM